MFGSFVAEIYPFHCRTVVLRYCWLWLFERIFKCSINVDFSVYASTMSLHAISISPKTYALEDMRSFQMPKKTLKLISENRLWTCLFSIALLGLPYKQGKHKKG